jgi:GNAT superfamily N-acetyltransferase
MEAVRSASPGDLDRLVELVAAFRGSRADHRGAELARPDDGGGTAPDATGSAMAPYLDDPARTALVGTLDDWVAGAALCRLSEDGGVTRGILDLCFVEPGARQVGLGHLLMEHALAWFRARGCSGVDGSAQPGDRSAKSFFESAGFKARLLVMHRPLD